MRLFFKQFQWNTVHLTFEKVLIIQIQELVLENFILFLLSLKSGDLHESRDLGFKPEKVSNIIH